MVLRRLRNNLAAAILVCGIAAEKCIQRHSRLHLKQTSQQVFIFERVSLACRYRVL